MKGILERLAALEADATGGEDGPVTVVFGCSESTTPKPRPPRIGDAVLHVAAGVAPPAWVRDRHAIFIPAETGPDDAAEDLEGGQS